MYVDHVPFLLPFDLDKELLRLPARLGAFRSHQPLGHLAPSSQSLTASSSFLVNEYRTARVAEILDDFRTLQYHIAAAPTEPPNTDDHYTEGWAALRQCAIDGQHILECAADTSVPSPDGGEEEQMKAELKQYVSFFFVLFVLRFGH